jgi:hypothetical protein
VVCNKSIGLLDACDPIRVPVLGAFALVRFGKVVRDTTRHIPNGR